jgi:ATP/maltotriose-dependent transcriptional regulator MalT
MDMMRREPTSPVQTREPVAAAPSFPILLSKLTPPFERPGMVSRIRILDRLEASAATPVVAICAPAGYGKTVLAAQWAKRDPRPAVWLSIDGHDNDPAVLVDHLPPGSQLVVISRGVPPLPVARWRAEDRLAEFGPADLAMGA